MAKDIRNYEVFISSPSDVAVERDIVEEAIGQMNQIRGSREGFRLTPIRWEKDVTSQIGKHPQEIINEQIGDDYDIFVGILCNRFGQKTESYESGTEEEFFRAYERHSDKTNSPEILFYFKDPRKSELPIDAEQLLKVADFKIKIGPLGIYEEFETPDSFKTMVLAALSKAIDRLNSRSVTNNHSKTQKTKKKPPSLATKNALTTINEFDEDIGLIELTDLAFDAIENFTDLLGTIATATERLGGRISTRTDEIGSLTPTGDTRHDQKAVKAVITKVAAEMQRYSHILDQAIPEAEREFSSALRGMQYAVMISKDDGMSSADDIKELVEELESMQSTLSTVHGQISNLESAIAATPRMTTKLNQAKRRTLKSVGDLLDFVSDASKNIDTTLTAIDQ